MGFEYSHRFSQVSFIFIGLYWFSCFSYLTIAFIDFNEYEWFPMVLQRFSMSTMFAKLIEHSFWRPRTPCTFRVVRFELTCFANGSAAWIVEIFIGFEYSSRFSLVSSIFIDLHWLLLLFIYFHSLHRSQWMCMVSNGFAKIFNVKDVCQAY